MERNSDRKVTKLELCMMMVETLMKVNFFAQVSILSKWLLLLILMMLQEVISFHIRIRMMFKVVCWNLQKPKGKTSFLFVIVHHSHNYLHSLWQILIFQLLYSPSILVDISWNKCIYTTPLSCGTHTRAIWIWSQFPVVVVVCRSNTTAAFAALYSWKSFFRLEKKVSCGSFPTKSQLCLLIPSSCIVRWINLEKEGSVHT